MEPSGAGGIFGFVNSAFKFSEFALRTTEVGSENELFVRMIQVVRKDLEETERLLHIPSVQHNLTSTPGKLPWIRESVHDTRCCLNDIGKWIERPRVDQQTKGGIRFETRVIWVFSDREKLMNRKMALSACHQQLLTVLTYLVPMEVAPIVINPPTCDDTTSLDDLMALGQAKKMRMESYDSNSNPASMSQKERTAESQSDTIPTNQSQITAARGTVYSASEPSLLHCSQTNFPGHSRTTSQLSLLPPSPTPSSLSLSSPAQNLEVVQRSEDAGPNTRSLRSISDTKMSSSQFVSSTSEHPNLRLTSYGPKYGLPETFEIGSDQTWANYADEPIPEIDGKAVYSNATNNLGPVNPFELLNTPLYTHNKSIQALQTPQHEQSFSIPLSHAQTAPELSRKRPESLAELVGDLYFPLELPGHETFTPHPTFRRVISDMPTRMPRRKPVPQRKALQSISRVPELVSELPSIDIPSTSDSSHASQPIRSLQASASMNDISELLKTSGSAPHSLPLPFNTMISSTSLALEPPVFKVDALSTSNPRTPTTTAAVRAERQKNLLDLLSSIE